MAEEAADQQSEVRKLDPRSLRALAHPLRVQILSTLREFGPATASQLADRLGESSGATSYHLRQLAAYDFVVEDPDRGTARERWWRSVHRGTRIDRDHLLPNAGPEIVGALSTFLYEVAAMHTRDLNTFLGTKDDWSEEWLRSTDMSDFQVRLTPELTREMKDRLHAVIGEYVDRLPEDAEGSERVRVHVHAFPRPAE